MEQKTFFIEGQVPAQKNAKKSFINRRTGKPFIMTDPKVKAWQEDASKQLIEAHITPFKGVVGVSAIFYHKDKRKRDIDNELASIMDLLKNNGIIEDDNCFIVPDIHIVFGGVSDTPGAKITITPLTP